MKHFPFPMQRALVCWRHSNIPFYINPNHDMLLCCCFTFFFSLLWWDNRCVRNVVLFYSPNEQRETNDVALHFARISRAVRCVSAVRCTIFTAIYGFEGFVNIILMFNETIINQIVCESKIATMTFFPSSPFSDVLLLFFGVMNAEAAWKSQSTAIAEDAFSFLLQFKGA